MFTAAAATGIALGVAAFVGALVTVVITIVKHGSTAAAIAGKGFSELPASSGRWEERHKCNDANE